VHHLPREVLKKETQSPHLHKVSTRSNKLNPRTFQAYYSVSMHRVLSIVTVLSFVISLIETCYKCYTRIILLISHPERTSYFQGVSEERTEGNILLRRKEVIGDSIKLSNGQLYNLYVFTKYYCIL
jgi:hypothetical protein